MGYSVYFKNDRWQGYGVPAYCDVKGCNNKIDRGLGYLHNDEDNSDPNVFCCEDHKYKPLVNLELNNGIREHPDWVNHLLDDPSWSKWRAENPETVQEYLKEIKL